ncbi:MAG: hypothetical protein NZZ60_02305 [Bacteroidia bacterium]|nr:hypothetical protein [Bacteroidia bacterium]MCX7652423.1 hypothetical protein [Bacteroidia bacterium]MDW8417344.1 hypothetical protein [Bacteroidia bacterium]
MISVALLGTMATLWLPHWSGSLYVLVALGYLFQGRWLYSLSAGGVMALIWLIMALSWDIPNERLLSHRVAELFGVSPSILWLITAIVGFLLGTVGVSLGQALRGVLPQKPPRLYERR